MELTEVSLPLRNRLVLDYLNANDKLSSFFNYFPLKDDTFLRRKMELDQRSFPREALADYLLRYHEQFNVSEETKKNIEQLRNEESQVIIGGQQAGVLSGPLYTIHKIISILKLAKQQEQKLGIPVLPVFWIAGEDHDFDEINHVNIQMNGKVKKSKLPQQQYKKEAVSNILLDKEACKKWVKSVFESFSETEFTNDLLEKINVCIQQSKTFVDFFVHTVFMLFPDQGLIVINSGDKSLRDIESSFMETLVQKNERLSEEVLKQQLNLKELGYGEPIELNEKSSHLFYQLNGERILLERDGASNFYGKNNECFFSKEELLDVVHNSPELLSNNVVTRPLMQEHLFPTLAFIGGPGEISYWSTLKSAFELFQFKIPPLVSRLNFTFIERKIDSAMTDLDLPLDHVLTYGLQEWQETWIHQQTDYNLDEIFTEVTEKINHVHQPVRQLAAQVDKGLYDVAEKNKQIIEGQLQFLRRKVEKSIRLQFDTELKKINEVNLSLMPLGLPQERVLNIFYFLNKFGPDFIDRIVDLELIFNNKHKIIYV